MQDMVEAGFEHLQARFPSLEPHREMAAASIVRSSCEPEVDTPQCVIVLNDENTDAAFLLLHSLECVLMMLIVCTHGLWY